jgi:hypothetical protein
VAGRHCEDHSHGNASYAHDKRSASPAKRLHGPRTDQPAARPGDGRRAGATITTADGSHVSLVSQPKVTIEAILAAAASVE